MTDIEAKALELDLIARVIGAYHKTRLSADAYEHVLRSPFVRDGLDRLNAASQSTTEARHATELLEQAERFSEAVRKAVDAGIDEWTYDLFAPFILPAPDPLVEALNEALLSEQDMGAQEMADAVRAAIQARRGKIVWEAGE